jgi:thiamine-monophosphate kinase
MNSRRNSNRISEFSLIKKYFAPLAGNGSFDLQDDAAEIVPSIGMSLVITQDAIAEDIHFFVDDGPKLIAQKALRVNLSDLAAKGATPKYISLALGLGKSWSEEWVAEFAKSLHQDCIAFGVQLTGGDTFTTGEGFVISITAIGELPSGQYVSRLGARLEDAIYVTGYIGDGALGLLARQNKLDGLGNEDKTYLVDRYLLPQPRTEISSSILKFATASMDISDGLVGDLEKLCNASDVLASIDVRNIPFSTATLPILESESNSLKTALTGGDDYEILLTVNPADCAAFENAVSSMSFPVKRIGTISSGQGVKVFDTDGQVIEFNKTSYDHSGENH